MGWREQVDTNHDGHVSFSELRAYGRNMSKQKLQAMAESAHVGAAYLEAKAKAARAAYEKLLSGKTKVKKGNISQKLDLNDDGQIDEHDTLLYHQHTTDSAIEAARLGAEYLELKAKHAREHAESLKDHFDIDNVDNVSIVHSKRQLKAKAEAQSLAHGADLLEQRYHQLLKSAKEAKGKARKEANRRIHLAELAAKAAGKRASQALAKVKSYASQTLDLNGDGRIGLDDLGIFVGVGKITQTTVENAKRKAKSTQIDAKRFAAVAHRLSGKEKMEAEKKAKLAADLAEKMRVRANKIQEQYLRTSVNTLPNRTPIFRELDKRSKRSNYNDAASTSRVMTNRACNYSINSMKNEEEGKRKKEEDTPIMVQTVPKIENQTTRLGIKSASTTRTKMKSLHKNRSRKNAAMAASNYANKLEAKAKVRLGMAERSTGAYKAKAKQRADRLMKAVRKHRAKAIALEQFSIFEENSFENENKEKFSEAKWNMVKDRASLRTKYVYEKAEELQKKANRIQLEANQKEGNHQKQLLLKNANRILLLSKKGKKKALELAYKDIEGGGTRMVDGEKLELQKLRSLPTVTAEKAITLCSSMITDAGQKRVKKIWKNLDIKHTGSLGPFSIRKLLAAFNIQLKDEEFRNFCEKLRTFRRQNRISLSSFFSDLYVYFPNMKKPHIELQFGKDLPYRPSSSKYKRDLRKDKLLSAEQAKRFFKSRIQNNWKSVEMQFKKLDVDGSGSLDTDEFRKLLRCFGINMDDNQFRKFCDINGALARGGGVLTLLDFINTFGKQVYSSDADDRRREVMRRKLRSRPSTQYSQGRSLFQLQDHYEMKMPKISEKKYKAKQRKSSIYDFMYSSLVSQSKALEKEVSNHSKKTLADACTTIDQINMTVSKACSAESVFIEGLGAKESKGDLRVFDGEEDTSTFLTEILLERLKKKNENVNESSVALHSCRKEIEMLEQRVKETAVTVQSLEEEKLHYKKQQVDTMRLLHEVDQQIFDLEKQMLRAESKVRMSKREKNSLLTDEYRKKRNQRRREERLQTFQQSILDAKSKRKELLASLDTMKMKRSQLQDELASADRSQETKARTWEMRISEISQVADLRTNDSLLMMKRSEFAKATIEKAKQSIVNLNEKTSVEKNKLKEKLAILEMYKIRQTKTLRQRKEKVERLEKSYEKTQERIKCYLVDVKESKKGTDILKEQLVRLEHVQRLLKEQLSGNISKGSNHSKIYISTAIDPESDEISSRRALHDADKLLSMKRSTLQARSLQVTKAKFALEKEENKIPALKESLRMKTDSVEERKTKLEEIKALNSKLESDWEEAEMAGIQTNKKLIYVKKQIDLLEGRVHLAEEKKKELEKKCKESRDLDRDLCSKIKLKQAKIKELKEKETRSKVLVEIKLKESAVQELETKLNQAENDFQINQQTLSEMKISVEEAKNILQVKKNDLEQKCKRLENENLDYKTSISQLRQECQEAMSQSSIASFKLRGVERTKLLLSNELSRYLKPKENRLLLMQQEKKQIEKDQSSLRKEKDKLLHDRNEISHTLFKQNDEQLNMKNNLRQQHGIVDGLKESVRIATVECNGFSAQLAKSENQLDEITDEIENLQREKETIHHRMEMARLSMERMKRLRVMAEKKYEECCAKKTNRMKRLNDMQHNHACQLRELNEKCARKESEKNNKQGEIVKWKGMIEMERIDGMRALERAEHAEQIFIDRKNEHECLIHMEIEKNINLSKLARENSVQISSLERQNEGLEKKINTCNVMIQNLMRKNDTEMEKLQICKKELNQMKHQSLEYELKERDFETKKKFLDRQMERLKSDIDKTDARISKMESEMTSKRKRFNYLKMQYQQEDFQKETTK
eukprot:g6321.t1